MKRPSINGPSLAVVIDSIEKLDLYTPLRQRVSDIAIGAAGYDWDNGADDLLTHDVVSRFQEALRVRFFEPKDRREVPVFTSVDDAARWLFTRGIRA